MTSFFVRKKGSKQRLVRDRSSTNHLSRQPPAMELVGGEGLQVLVLRGSAVLVAQGRRCWGNVFLPIWVALAPRPFCCGHAVLLTGLSLPGALWGH